MQCLCVYICPSIGKTKNKTMYYFVKFYTKINSYIKLNFEFILDVKRGENAHQKFKNLQFC